MTSLSAPSRCFRAILSSLIFGLTCLTAIPLRAQWIDSPNLIAPLPYLGETLEATGSWEGWGGAFCHDFYSGTPSRKASIEAITVSSGPRASITGGGADFGQEDCEIIMFDADGNDRRITTDDLGIGGGVISHHHYALKRIRPYWIELWDRYDWTNQRRTVGRWQEEDNENLH